MNRTIKETTAKRFDYVNHDQLHARLSNFVDAYNFARRLKTLMVARHTSSSASSGQTNAKIPS